MRTSFAYRRRWNRVICEEFSLLSAVTTPFWSLRSPKSTESAISSRSRPDFIQWFNSITNQALSAFIRVCRLLQVPPVGPVRPRDPSTLASTASVLITWRQLKIRENSWADEKQNRKRWIRTEHGDPPLRWCAWAPAWSTANDNIRRRATSLDWKFQKIAISCLKLHLNHLSWFELNSDVFF